MRSLLVPTAALLVVAFGAPAAQAIDSGLEVGKRPAAYNVKDVTGPRKGDSLCYVWVYGARPVINVFAREITDNLASLVKELDAVVGERQDKQMRAFVVILTEDPEADAAKLADLQETHGIEHIPLTLFEGVAGPGPYNIAQEADVSVMMWDKQQVKVNHALEKGKLDAAKVKEIVADAAKLPG